MIETDNVLLKSMVQDSVNEFLKSNKDMLYSIFYEAFEDFMLVKAIEEGENSGIASREEVFAVLEGK